MNKRIIIRLVLIMVGAIAILGTLMAITTMPNENNNGFVRKWGMTDALIPIDKILLEEDLSGLIGISDNSIFIVGKRPTGILIINRLTHKKDTLNIDLNFSSDKLVPFYSKVDSPKLYLHLNNAGILIDGKFPNSQLRINKLNIGVFLRSVQLDDSIVVIKTVDTSFQYQMIGKFNLNSKKFEKFVQLKDELKMPLEVQYDGMLFYDDRNKKILNVEYFRNKIICLDSNLNISYESKTIDTVSSLQLNLNRQKASDTTDKLTSSEARVAINSKGAIYQGKLFLISNLRSDNQDIIQFNTHTSIDIYDIEGGAYLQSVMIENLDNKSANSIYLKNNELYALFDKTLLIYKIDF